MPHFRKLSEFGKGIPNFIFDAIGRFDIILSDETPDFEYVVENLRENPEVRVYDAAARILAFAARYPLEPAPESAL